MLSELWRDVSSSTQHPEFVGRRLPPGAFPVWSGFNIQASRFATDNENNSQFCSVPRSKMNQSRLHLPDTQNQVHLPPLAWWVQSRGAPVEAEGLRTLAPISMCRKSLVLQMRVLVPALEALTSLGQRITIVPTGCPRHPSGPGRPGQEGPPLPHPPRFCACEPPQRSPGGLTPLPARALLRAAEAPSLGWLRPLTIPPCLGVPGFPRQLLLVAGGSGGASWVRSWGGERDPSPT